VHVVFVWKREGNTPPADGGVGGRIVLKGILKKYAGRTRAKLIVDGNKERYMTDS